MANALYGFGREAFMSGSINWNSDVIKVALLSSSYAPSINTDRFLANVNTGISLVNTAVSLTGSTGNFGVADANDITFLAVTGSYSTSNVTYILLYKDTGSAATSPLIALIDTATGLPLTPNGGDITIQWDNAANKIFKL